MEFLEFVSASPTAFHAVAEVEKRLVAAGAAVLKEKDAWDLKPGKTYAVKRNGSAIIAFTVPKGVKGYRVFACHADSPMFKIKENPELSVENRYVRLDTERYGGMILSTWFDRPLSVAGRVVVKKGRGLEEKLVDFGRDLLIIPNVAIHQMREINDGFAPNPQVDLLPLYGGGEAKGRFMQQVAELAGVKEEDVRGHDLFVYNREKGTVWGANGEFMSSPRIDDLECAYCGISGFLAGSQKRYGAVYALFDNEEVGSASRQGAASTFLKDTLERISEALGDTAELKNRRIADSFLLSADNGHAVHPNHPEKCDPANRPYLNGGVLLKFSANQRYTTDGVSAAMFRAVAEKAGVPTQVFFNRSDTVGGSTLGNLSVLQVPFPSADIGLAQLAMHSSYETAGVHDLESMTKLATAFFE